MSDTTEDRSEPCPFCGYRAATLPASLRHLAGHITGNYTSGRDQLDE